MARIVDRINACQADGKVCFSFEYFPPKTPAGVTNLYARMERMKAMEPEFIDVTWGAGGSTAGLSMEIASTARNVLGLNVLLHMTCTNMTREQIRNHLLEAKRAGITNILALRGDPPHGSNVWVETEGGFSYATDLVRFIKSDPEFSSFGIVVAGYPDPHPESKSAEEDIMHLKEKVDAGADVIVTQMFYDADLFLTFVKKCREAGIHVPIVPGIMPIDGYESFMRRTQFCGTKVPKWVYEVLEPIKNDDAEVKAFGIRYVTAMCRTLLNHGTPALHLYTMNLEKSVTTLYHALKQSSKSPSSLSGLGGSLVFSPSMVWDDFPNGFCGDSASPSFGADSDGYGVRFTGNEAFYKEHKQAVKELKDIVPLVEAYMTNALASLPWSPLPLSGESALLVDRLISLNRKMCFTMSSQPAVNGVSSTDAVFGWGGKGGHVYQKAYVQAIVAPQIASVLQNHLESKANTGNRFSWHVCRLRDNTEQSNVKGKNVLTWGVWPGREVVQSTWVDASGVKAVAQNVVATVRAWAKGFPAEREAEGQVVLALEDWYLVHVVDEQFWDVDQHHRTQGDVWELLDAIVGQTASS